MTLYVKKVCTHPSLTCSARTCT